MTRAQMVLAVWASIQLLFFSSFGLILWKVTRIYHIVKRIDKRVEARALEMQELAAKGGLPS